MRCKSLVLVLVLFVSLTPASHAQRANLGRITFPTSGPAPAQAVFVRGVLLLHSFEYDEAIEAFRQAQRLAPDFAMAYWGEAMCYNQPLWYNENLAKARETLRRLGPTRDARAAKAPTAREKGYLDAVERLFGNGVAGVRRRAYADRMAALTAADPGDDEAALFHALAMLAQIPRGERRPDVSLKAGAIATAVLKKNPQHPGAAHYTLHAYDEGEHTRLGLEAARIYAKVAPASSHALHMPSHIFVPLGMWDEASASDEASFAASVAWVKRTGRTIAQQDFHSLSWLQYEYLQQGRFTRARELSKPVAQALAQSADAPAHASGAGAGHVESEIGRGFDQTSLKSELASMRARMVIDSGAWAEMRGQGTFGNVDELFALGWSSVKLGDLARADAAIGHLGMAGKAAPDRDTREVVAIMADQLSGLVQMARGAGEAGRAALARAADAEARRPRPIARPDPIKPAAEAYGEALLAAGDTSAAKAQFERALARTPRRAAALLGLARAAHAAGMVAEATRAAKEFLDMWHAADADRPEIAEAQSMLVPR